MPVAGGQVVQQFDAGAARGAQSCNADMCARHARQTLLFDAPVLALADDAQPEPVAVERKAALGVGGGDRGVVDAEKQPVPLLPARIAFAGRVLDQLQRMPVGIAKIHGADAAGIRVPRRQELRPGGDRRGPVP